MRFKDKELERFWERPGDFRSTRIPPQIRKQLFRRLQMLDGAFMLEDLRVPPGNHLEALRGSRAGQYSIRVNSQWRLCFVWAGTEAKGVELCDYHR